MASRTARHTLDDVYKVQRAAMPSVPYVSDVGIALSWADSIKLCPYVFGGFQFSSKMQNIWGLLLNVWLHKAQCPWENGLPGKWLHFCEGMGEKGSFLCCYHKVWTVCSSSWLENKREAGEQLQTGRGCRRALPPSLHLLEDLVHKVNFKSQLLGMMPWLSLHRNLGK